MREPWTGRKFPFEHPVERIGTFLSRLRGTASRITAAVRGLDDDALTARDGERWSPQEHIGHLHVLDALHLRRVAELQSGVETLTAADMSNQATWDADFNARTFAEVHAAFVERRDQLVGQLAALDKDALGQAALHPRLQTPMRTVDVAYFTAEHDDNHLATIEAIATARSGKPARAMSANWRDLPHDAPMPLLGRHRLIGRETMISHITLQKGCQVPVHAHANEQIACVLSGRVKFTLDDGERVLGAGEVLHLPSFASHGAEALETAVVLDVFTPPSETTGIDAN